MKKTWSIALLVLVVAQVVLMFLPWLTLDNDVHPYTIPDIMEIQSWWRGWGASFGLPFFCLWIAVIATCLTIVLQLVTSVFIFLGKPISEGRLKALVVLSAIACLFAVLMYIAFHFNVDTAFPTLYMGILPVSLILNILMFRNRKRVS